MARALYVPRDIAEKVLDELASRSLIVRTEEHAICYCYQSGSEEQDALLTDVDATYRQELVRISGLIHSKASVAVRDFARAFRFKKD